MQIIDNAIRTLTNLYPWVGRVCNRLPKTYSDTLPDGSHNPTMATNGKAIFINPAFARSLNPSERIGVLAHEAIHVIQRHPLRRGNRDPEIYAIAIDAATNHIVIDQLYLTLPEDRIPEKRGTVEQIYAWLANSQPPQQQSTSGSEQQDEDGQEQGEQGGQGEGEAGGMSQGDNAEPIDSKSFNTADCLDYPLEPDQTIEDAHREIDLILAEAELDMKMAGTSANDTESNIFEWQKTELNWPSELQDYVHLIGGADYSMRPPHVGLAQAGIICNQLNPTGCGNVVIAVDVSGSINKKKLDLALTHLMLFVENMDYESLRVIACNRTVQFDRTFYRGETPDISEMPTGGSTAFMPVFELIEEGAAPDLFLYFTDMAVYMPEDFTDPGYPIVWLVDEEGLVKDGAWNPEYRKPWAIFKPDFGHIIDTCQ